MSFRDGIIFKIASPHTEKIYIGCSSLPLNRAVSGLRASAKFRKLSCNILFQAGDIQSEVLEKFQDITVLEMRKKLGAIQTQYLEKCVNTNRAGRTNADRYRETKRQLEMYRENKDMFNRKHALKNMRIRGLPPRPSTILKYNITDEEIADCCKRVYLFLREEKRISGPHSSLPFDLGCISLRKKIPFFLPLLCVKKHAKRHKTRTHSSFVFLNNILTSIIVSSYSCVLLRETQ